MTRHCNAILFACALAALSLATSAQAQYKIEPKYSIGIDARSDLTGAYTGLANPNYGRLTFLYAHTYADAPQDNHFHRLGAYAFTGPNLGASTATTFTNNTLPEGGVNRLELKSGGSYYVSGLDTSSEYEGLSITSLNRIEPTAQSSPTSPEGRLYNSSILPATSLNAGQPRYAALNSLLGSRTFALELVSRTPGLEIGTAAGISSFTNPGDRYTLGTASQLATDPFLPVFWSGVQQTETEQQFSATFMLVDLDTTNPLPSSGEFTYQFKLSAAPEPGSLALGLLALPVLGLLARRRSANSLTR
jgi:hypothetical protein